MTGLSRIFDASTPPQLAPAGCAGVLGYIGRPGFTPHVWMPAEWQRFAHLTQFPAWLPDFTQHAGAEATAIVTALKAAGWEPEKNALRTLAVVIDYETSGAAEAEWHGNLADALGSVGYDAIAYGSLSSVVQIEAAHVWAADWNGEADLSGAGMTVHAHQYLDAGSVDYSVADDWLMARGLRRG